MKRIIVMFTIMVSLFVKPLAGLEVVKKTAQEHGDVTKGEKPITPEEQPSYKPPTPETLTPAKAAENWYKDIETSLKASQTEITKKRAIVDYQSALEKAAAGQMDAPKLLELITAKGGLLTRVLADPKTKEIILKKEFIDRVPAHDMLAFTEKIAQAYSAYPLDEVQRKAYGEVFKGWVDELIRKESVLNDSDLERLKRINTTLALEKIRLNLAKPGQAEAVRKAEVNAYREVLQKASERTYDIKTVLDFLTPTGGLLDAILKTKDISDGLVAADFMDDVNLENLLSFANKLVVLGANKPNTYNNFYRRFMENLAKKAKREKNISDNNLNDIATLLAKLPEKGESGQFDREKAAVYAQWFDIFQKSAGPKTIETFIHDYANALQRSGSVSAIAEGIALLKKQRDSKTLRPLQLLMLQGAMRPDYMQVLSPETRAAVIAILDDLAINQGGIDRTTISSIADSINTAIANVKSALAKAKEADKKQLQESLENLRAVRTSLISKINSWKDGITIGKDAPRFMKDFLRKDEAFLNQALFGRSEARVQDIEYQNIDDFIDSLQAISAYMKLYPEKNFPTEHAFLKQEALKRFVQPKSTATKTEDVTLDAPLSMDQFKALFSTSAKVLPTVNENGRVTGYTRLKSFPNKFALLTFWDGTPKERKSFVETIGNDSAVIFTLYELLQTIPTLKITPTRMNQLKSIAAKFENDLVDNALNQAAAFNKVSYISALPAPFFERYLNERFSLDTPLFEKNLNDTRFLTALTDEQFSALVKKIETDVSSEMTKYVQRLVHKESVKNISAKRKRALEDAIAQHQNLVKVDLTSQA